MPMGTSTRAGRLARYDMLSAFILQRMLVGRGGADHRAVMTGAPAPGWLVPSGCSV